MKPQSTLCQSLTHEILLWAIDLIVPFCRYTLLPTWGSSSNSLALACLALPRLLLQVTFFFHDALLRMGQLAAICGRTPNLLLL